MKLENAGRELVAVLLERVRALGLISDAVCARARDLVYSAMEPPDFFRCPVCPEEADSHESAEDPR